MKLYDNPYQTEKWEAEKKKTSKKILCYSCHQPIHIEHLAGITRAKGKEAWFCDNIFCLLEFDKITNSEIDVGQKKEKFIKTSEKATKEKNAG